MNIDEFALYLINYGIEVITSKWIGWGKPDEQVSPYLSSGEWTTGGLGGGNCWGDGADYPIEAEEEREFTSLDKTLALIWPNISYLEYKNLAKELIEVKDTSSYEYYGNYTTHSEKIVDLEQLLNYLKEKNVI